ncbi:MAG: UDP-4-amino-4,6-dideoxy-N-acetyl-beta-L-altrosamine transaminase [Bacteroidota bacterium]
MKPAELTLPIPYGRQHITDADISAVVSTLKSDYLTQGPKLAQFEEAFANYVGATYAVGCANGTAALHLCTLALGVPEGKKVIGTPLTFAASLNCVRYVRGEVDFVDIDPDTFLIDLNQVEDKLRKEPNAYAGIIPVDFAGYPVDLSSLRTLADRYGCWIVEDSCHAPGGYQETPSGSQSRCGSGEFADLAIFSFHPVKHIAAGEGGMVTTQDKDLYEKLKLFRTHGITKRPDLLQENHGGWYYEMHELGYNYRLSELQAALGGSQLEKANDRLARRRELAGIYDKAFQDTPIKAAPRPSHQGHAYHLYVVQAPRRKELYDYLRTQHIFTQVHYIPVHLLPYYQKLGWKKGDFPYAEAYYDQCLSLPLYPSLSEVQQQYVIEQVKGFFQDF